MSLDIKLTNDNLIAYARSSDALEAFYNSVNNGQMRLALEVFAEILPVLVDKINELDDNSSKTDLVIDPKVEEKPKTKPTKSSDIDSKEQAIEA